MREAVGGCWVGEGGLGDDREGIREMMNRGGGVKGC